MNLAYLRDILLYLRANSVHVYRMHCGILPPLRGNLSIAAQLTACRAQLDRDAELIAEDGVRLSFHPFSDVDLSAPSQDRWRRSQQILSAQANLMQALGLGPEAVIILHVGGVYRDREAAMGRFVRRYLSLPEWIRPRLVLENDDRRFDLASLQWIHARCGIPLVFDRLHHLVLNREGVPQREALEYCLATWPDGVVPKVHFSSPRTEMRRMEGTSRLKTPSWTEHSDFVNPFAFIAFARQLDRCDVMLEAKARDLALLQLRRDVARFAPDLVDKVC